MTGAALATGVLLAGCGVLPPPASPASSPPLGDQTQVSETPPSAAVGAECLTGTWQEDIVAFTAAMKSKNKSLIGTWSGGVFLRFDGNDTFYLTNEDFAFDSNLGGLHVRSVVNGATVGDYTVEGDGIRFTNYTAVWTDSRTYNDGELVLEDDKTYATEFGEGLSPFTCNEETLNLTRTVEGFTISHVYARIMD